jgi:hypothetical protein
MDPESQVREVLLKDKFLIVSPDICKKLSLWLKEKKSLDQLIQLAMSIYYNQDITNRKKKKRHDLIAAPIWLGPTSWVCYHGGQEGHFCRECLRGNSLGDSPTPKQDPALSTKVTTGSLIAPISRWKVRCHLLWIDGSQPPVHAPFLSFNVKEPYGSNYNNKKRKIFSNQTVELISLPVPSPMTRLSFRTNLASP